MFEHLDDDLPFRADDAFRTTTLRRGRRRRVRRRIAGGASLLGGSLVLLVVGLTLWTDRQLDRVDRVDIGEEVLTPEPTDSSSGPTEPTYFLVVGVDGGADAVPTSPPRVTRSDTVMLVRADPGGRLSVLSVPRDLWVSYGEDEGRVNEALERGGPELLIQVVGDTLGVPVHHYVQIDMAGFVAIVDQVGGVGVYSANPMRDTTTGLELAMGCTTVDGGQALALVRSRHTEVFDPATGQWFADPSADLGRTARQRQFAIAAVQGIVALEPTPDDLHQLLDALADHASLDDAVSDDELLGWARWLISRGESNVTSYELPVEQGTVGQASVLFPADGWDAAIAAFTTGATPPQPPPGATTSSTTGSAGIVPC